MPTPDVTEEELESMSHNVSYANHKSQRRESFAGWLMLLVFTLYFLALLMMALTAFLQ